MFKATVKKSAPEPLPAKATEKKIVTDPAVEITGCVEENCNKPLAPGQTFVCPDHVRTN